MRTVRITRQGLPNHGQHSWINYFKFILSKKYNKHYTKYNTVLKKLYNQSINRLPNRYAFQIFQQIALRNKVSLKELVGIEFNSDVNDQIINYIRKYYPNVQINIIKTI